ncbi:MAG: hydantoinase/oxoprolinase family protein [Rhodospirillaceae bacterium]|jgi:N-methylhydantoinase A|nr:hydantoinase/oxoprolinase family protein [Rhodospirillaceae bacterium]MBT4045204.1 hydantoinase/oxoprolinase family protein [Rhodospirillaceae bacterium]MBT4688870.1 hydantoinase/oxoprolinase family protein [Rhodospirillaceae bacterium]MBT5079614.1 hydantoinase/oxoprolinase family protein [Rhodospirillaceae bacterium]MBT5524703.1 hydantoinase/oxoprolinase family protein [Rhodospirillaceae bacterium]
MAKFRVGADIGGTFTDLVLLGHDGTLHTKKVPSTVGAYEVAIVEGLSSVFDSAGLQPDQIEEVLHGTTVASNAILEHKGARTGLITTKGFRDVLEIRTLRMPRLYDLHWEKPPPLAPRYLRLDVDERINNKGGVDKALDLDEVERVVQRLLDEKVETIAVCLINSYANDSHERAIKGVIERMAPDLLHCISADVLPEILEYQRTSTTVINAYVMPIVSNYLQQLSARLGAAKIDAPLLLMQSNGGLINAAVAERKPANIIESGPAGGVVGAQALARKLDLPDIITFDMGGTTAKASLVEDGEFTRSLDYQVGGGIMIGSRLMSGAGYHLKIPAIDLAEVGAGGGSLVWIDAGGSMQIGPESAGAMPGPVCYGMGGEEPTVTDANVILGYLNPDFLVGGELELQADKSSEVFQEKVANRMGLDLAHAAYGAHQIVISNMIRAIRAISSERGRDPRDYALFAFGGNGPLFAAGMAKALDMRRIVVPPFPGLFSSFGLLYADVEHHYSRSMMQVLRDAEPSALNDIWGGLEAEARAQLTADGYRPEQIDIRRTANMHYKGQIYELSVPAPDGDFDPDKVAELEERFGVEHERTYGHRAGPEEPVMLVNAQLIGRAIPDHPPVPDRLKVMDSRTGTQSSTRQAYFGPELGWLEAKVLARTDLASTNLGGEQTGPIIVEEYDATCLVPPGATAKQDDFGNIIIELPE